MGLFSWVQPRKIKSTLKNYPTLARTAVVAVVGDPLNLEVLKDSKTLTISHATRAYKRGGKMAR